MITRPRRLSLELVAMLLLLSSQVSAASPQLNEAITRYYQGYPAQAIEMIEPLAVAGDVEAQYLLGNLLYSLSKAGVVDAGDDAIEWYRKAAEQRSADASFALGAIFDNQWRRSGIRKHAAKAIVHYRAAVDLGHAQASSALARIQTRSGLSDEAAAALSDVPDETPVVRPEPPAPAASRSASNTAAGEIPIVTAESGDGSSQGAAADSDAESASNAELPGDTRAAPGEYRNPVVMLAQVAAGCEQYTEAGFILYADTIRGARLSGTATVTSVERDAANSETYSITLVSNNRNAPVSLDLRQVPDRLASNFARGKPADFTGIIVESATSGSGCSIILRFQPESG